MNYLPALKESITVLPETLTFNKCHVRVEKMRAAEPESLKEGNAEEE